MLHNSLYSKLRIAKFAMRKLQAEIYIYRTRLANNRQLVGNMFQLSDWWRMIIRLTLATIHGRKCHAVHWRNAAKLIHPYHNIRSQCLHHFDCVDISASPFVLASPVENSPVICTLRGQTDVADPSPTLPLKP